MGAGEELHRCTQMLLRVVVNAANDQVAPNDLLDVQANRWSGEDGTDYGSASHRAASTAKRSDAPGARSP